MTTLATPTLSVMQNDAVNSVKNWWNSDRFTPSAEGRAAYYTLDGFAGTGKSTILPAIVESLLGNFEGVHFCAPTGKAAKVMTQKLNDFGINKAARTIHSSIYKPRPTKTEFLERELETLERELLTLRASNDSDSSLATLQEDIRLKRINLEKAYDKEEGPKFSLNVDSEVRKASLIVVDERSMVGAAVAKDLLSFGIPVLALGDPGQLPPVGDNPGFDSPSGHFVLTEVHRQAKDNPIIRIATMVREGKMLREHDYGDGVRVVSKRNDDATYNMDIDAQIICGTHNRRFMITQKLRRMMDLGGSAPQRDEPLICCKNSRNNTAFVNGAVFQTISARHEGEPIVNLEEGYAYFELNVRDEMGGEHKTFALQSLFEEHFMGRGAFSCSKSDKFRASIERDHFDYAWAITCHKSQGSQWDNVVVHDEGAVFREDADKWRYTAVTRAAKTLTVVV